MKIALIQIPEILLLFITVFTKFLPVNIPLIWICILKLLLFILRGFAAQQPSLKRLEHLQHEGILNTLHNE